MSIKKIIVHCSVSDNPKHDSISVIDKWHRKRGFKMVGYHDFIKKNGHIEAGRPLNMVGAHTKGHNEDSIGVCLSGEHDFTPVQMNTLKSKIKYYCKRFNLTLDDVYPHNYFNKDKTCPNFDLEELKKEINGL